MLQSNKSFPFPFTAKETYGTIGKPTAEKNHTAVNGEHSFKKKTFVYIVSVTMLVFKTMIYFIVSHKKPNYFVNSKSYETSLARGMRSIRYRLGSCQNTS